ncbi:hypothetical protein [Acidithrix ferrooxidans]|uniref:Uncharacterized protein n=1 Tax=Acidithrix ferrooxidans TaxID=1280514 RepID=A0A0D8HES8_9ACTN|nr:hypothetical protein [Acidithrix ferrooxidans]KJF15561.1 hypothetical protein AXFE_35860 [Acidithrix ferrooxidans]
MVSTERVPRTGPREWVSVALLLLGGFVVGLGWFAGLILLWSSRVWTRKQKLVGTLVLPGGLLAPVIWFGVNSRATDCTTATNSQGRIVFRQCITSEFGLSFTTVEIVFILGILACLFSIVYLIRAADLL